MAKPKYDTELFLTDIKSIFQDNLNNKIDEINLEKQNDTVETNDNFDIPNIQAKAWYLSHVPQVWSQASFIVWGISDVSLSEQQSGAFVKTIKVFVEVALPDKGDKINEASIYKLLRYTRSLEEVANENFDKIRRYGQIKIDSSSPVAIAATDTQILSTAGITITASFGM